MWKGEGVSIEGLLLSMHNQSTQIQRRYMGTGYQARDEMRPEWELQGPCRMCLQSVPVKSIVINFSIKKINMVKSCFEKEAQKKRVRFDCTHSVPLHLTEPHRQGILTSSFGK